ncbi:tail tubular protein [Vibrio phage VPp1]|nr:tail tubular protein [Vibrio phage VPp1]
MTTENGFFTNQTQFQEDPNISQRDNLKGFYGTAVRPAYIEDLVAKAEEAAAKSYEYSQNSKQYRDEAEVIRDQTQVINDQTDQVYNDTVQVYNDTVSARDLALQYRDQALGYANAASQSATEAATSAANAEQSYQDTLAVVPSLQSQIDEKATKDELNEGITESQNDILGGSIFKGSNGEFVQDGDTVPAGTTHLRVLVGGKPTIVAMSPTSAGAVSSLTDFSATIGGTPVAFTKKNTSNYLTLNDALTSPYIALNSQIEVKERVNGSGGDGIKFDVVLTASVTPNGFDIIQSVSEPSLSLKMRNESRRFSSFGVVKESSNLSAFCRDVALNKYDANYLDYGTYNYSGNLFLADGQILSGKGSGNTISSNKGTRLKPTNADAKIRLFPHAKLSDVFIDGEYSESNKAVVGIYIKPHDSGDTDYVPGDPTTLSCIWTKVSNVNIQKFFNNISIEGESFNLWFENLVSVAGRFKQVGGGESTLTACNLSDTTGQEIVLNDGGKISVHGGAIQNTNGGYPCIINKGKMLLQGVYMENARAGANNNGYLIDNYGTLTLVQPKSMAIADKAIRGRYGSKTYLRDVEFTGNNANTNEVFNGRGDNNNEGGGYLYFENLTLRSCLTTSINYIEHAIGGYSDKGYSIECGNEKTLYLNEGANLTDLTSSGGTLTANNTAEYLTNGESLRFVAASSAPSVTLTKTLRGLSGHLVMVRWAVLAKPSASDNTRFLANIGGDVTCAYVNVEFDADSANGNTDKWYYITTSAVLDPQLTEHTITCNLFTSLGGSGASNGTSHIDRIELVDCGEVHKA